MTSAVLSQQQKRDVLVPERWQARAEKEGLSRFCQFAGRALRALSGRVLAVSVLGAGALSGAPCLMRPSPLTAKQQTHRGGGGVRAVSGSVVPLEPPGVPVAEAEPVSAAAVPWLRRRWELSMMVGATAVSCSPFVRDCSPGYGAETGAVLWRRPDSFFAWGLELGAGQYRVPSSAPEPSADAQHRWGRAGIGLRAYPLPAGRWEPWIHFIGGGGLQERRFPVSGARGQGSIARLWAPLVQFALGSAVFLDAGLRAGVALSWTYWLVQEQDRCQSGGGRGCGLSLSQDWSTDTAQWALTLQLEWSLGRAL